MEDQQRDPSSSPTEDSNGNGNGNGEPKASKPWHSYISEELPRSIIDSRDSAVRSARSLHHNSSTYLSSFQDQQREPSSSPTPIPTEEPPNANANGGQPKASKPWHSYISEELPRSIIDSRDSAVRSARSLHHNSSTYLSSFQDFMLDVRSKYAIYEDAFFKRVKDGVTTAREHPTITAGVGLSAAFLLLPGPRRFLVRHTLGRLQSEEARFVKAEKNVNMLSLSVDLMKKESKKLLQRADLAEKEMLMGQTELRKMGKQFQSLARSADKVEAQAADLMDLLREIPGREAIRLRAEVASVTALLRQQRNSISKRMMKLSDMGVAV